MAQAAPPEPAPTRRLAAAGIISRVSIWFRTYGFDEILDDLLIGAYPLDADDVAMLHWAGVRRVLNLTEDDEYRRGEREVVTAAYRDAGIDEYRLEFIDHGPLSPEGTEATVQEVLRWLDEAVRSYVHCRAGWQRSPAIAAGVVAVRNHLEIEAALEFVQARKPSADPLPHQREDLLRWWRQRDQLDSGAGG